jgi:hypothetical protein
MKIARTFQQLADIYPMSPGFKSDGTSRQAANAIAPMARNLRGRVLEYIKASTAPPMADEIADQLGKSVLSVRPRVAELHRLGEIRPAESRGKNESGHAAARWKPSPPLQAAFAREGSQ